MLTFCVSRPINAFSLQNSFIRYHVEVCSSWATSRPTKKPKCRNWIIDGIGCFYLNKSGTRMGPTWALVAIGNQRGPIVREQAGNMPLVYIVYSCCTCHIPSHQLRESLMINYTKSRSHILNMDFEVIVEAHVVLVLHKQPPKCWCWDVRR